MFPDTAALGRWIAGLWLLVSIPLGAFALGSWLRPSTKGPRRLRWTVLLLLAVALLVRLLGADHEVGERAYQDEGTYYHHATEINRGHPWRWSFVYGHLSYYSGAFGLWMADLFPDQYATIATWWSGTSEPLAHQWLVLRLLVAILSAVTVLPVFGIAWLIASPTLGTAPQNAINRIFDGPLLAATLAAALYIFSPVFNDGSHLIISDYPAACLATFCLYFVAQITVRPISSDRDELELWRQYLGAGLFAGLAAATKYPAGTVAISIVVVWLYRAWKRHCSQAKAPWLHTLSALAISGGSSIAIFLASMPTFIRGPYQAVFAPRGMLFGLHQYSKGGWIGVMPESLGQYYLSLLAQALGWAALLALVLSPAFLRARVRRGWLLMATFPAAYLLLLLSMNMVVKRNLAPAIPIMAALSGIAILSIAQRLSLTLAPRHPRLLIATLAILSLASPTWATLQQTVGLARLSTREEALHWMVANLPRGTRVFRESYTPRLPADHFFLRRARFAARVPLLEIEQDGYEYLLLAGPAFNRFLDPKTHREPHHAVMAQRYLQMFERYRTVRQFVPGRWRRGPTLWLLAVVPAMAKENA